MNKVRKELILKAINQGTTFDYLTTYPPFITFQCPMSIRQYNIDPTFDGDYWNWYGNKAFFPKARKLSKEIVPAIHDSEEDGWHKFLDRGIPFDMQLIWECGTIWPILGVNGISDATSRNLLQLGFLARMMSPTKLAILQYLFVKGTSERYGMCKEINGIWRTTSAVHHRFRDMKKDEWIAFSHRNGRREHWTITPKGVEKLILMYPHVLEMGVLDQRNSDLVAYMRKFLELK